MLGILSAMNTYFIRHTATLDIDDATRQKLWGERRIAIHFPHDAKGRLGKRDNASCDPDDYSPTRGLRQMRALATLADEGGYVCAEYHGQSECVLGFVKPKSKIELVYGHWGSVNKYQGRKAILKSLRLSKVKSVRPGDSAAILVGRPRQGTIMRWKQVGQMIENIVEGRRIEPSLELLSPAQQEIMCSEFLRSPAAQEFGLPRLEHLLLPVGRTMKGIDICGITESGTRLFAQVTFRPFDQCTEKLDALLLYRDGDLSTIILFCDCLESTTARGAIIVPLRRVYDEFVRTQIGKLWLESAVNPV